MYLGTVDPYRVCFQLVQLFSMHERPSRFGFQATLEFAVPSPHPQHTELFASAGGVARPQSYRCPPALIPLRPLAWSAEFALRYGARVCYIHLSGYLPKIPDKYHALEGMDNEMTAKGLLSAYQRFVWSPEHKCIWFLWICTCILICNVCLYMYTYCNMYLQRRERACAKTVCLRATH